jgi:hypothetical protein
VDIFDTATGSGIQGEPIVPIDRLDMKIVFRCVKLWGRTDRFPHRLPHFTDICRFSKLPIAFFDLRIAVSLIKIKSATNHCHHCHLYVSISGAWTENICVLFSETEHVNISCAMCRERRSRQAQPRHGALAFEDSTD